MGVVRLLAGCDIRRRWRAVVALVLLVGAVGAIALAAAAGARRSDSALARFNAYSRSSSVEMFVGEPSAKEVAAFRRTPEVGGFALLRAYALTVGESGSLAIAAPVGPAMGTVVDRPRLLEGRLADPSAADEMTIGEAFAAAHHVGVGDHFDSDSFTPAQVVRAYSGGRPEPPRGPKLRLRIVGIVRRPLDLGDRAAAGGVVVLTPGFNTKYQDRIGLYTSVLRVRTRAGAADLPRVIAAARKLWGKDQTFGVQPLGIETEGAHNAIDVLTSAIWIFAAMTALAGAVAIGIVLTRDVAHVSVDQAALRALGVTRGRRVMAAATRAVLIAGSGALLAGLGALALSPFFPLGAGRRADPDVGLHADWLVLAVGVLLVAAVVLAIASLAAWRATRTLSPDRIARSRRHTSPVVELAARAGLSPTATNGLRMALQARGGESSVPVRSAFAGAVFGIAGITAVLVFAASLSHLAATPRLSGWTWDVKTIVDDHPKSVCVDEDDHGLARAPGVSAVAVACIRGIQIDNHPVSAWAFESLHGEINPEVVAGRAPRNSREVALGAVTLQKVHKHIGETVKAQGDAGTRTFRIVGRIVLPSIGAEDVQPLADGASFTIAGFRPLVEEGENETHYLLASFAPGADRGALQRQVKAIPRSSETGGPTTAIEINRVEQINWFPAILAGLLAILALVAVGHALVTSVRRRRREIALLKTIGFGRRQVGATIAWQATTLAAVGIVVGIPIGLLIGRVVWRAVANGLGVSTAMTVPVVALLLASSTALVLVNLIAFFPGRAAARTPPAAALRSE